MKKRVKYIGYFDFANSKIKRYYITAAANKLLYIIESINKVNIGVDLLSFSACIEPKFKYYKKQKKKINDISNATFIPSFGGSSIIVKGTRYLICILYLFLYLIFVVKKNETIIVYHSLGYLSTIIWAKKIKKFRLILEVEEIYQDVSNMSCYYRNLEYKMFDIADAYIFSTELLDKKLNVSHKPSCIIYGTYKAEPQLVDKFNDGKIHIVYAGTFDVRKGGAAAAAAATEFLPENYHVHICGFGSEKDTNFIKNVILEIAAKSKATISFEGLLKGKEYIEFIQRCHIGLSTQDPNAAFNATSFPSKILSYMANGLTVVSIRIDAVEKAAIGKHINYYDIQDPHNIANAIMNAKDNINSRNVINQLNIEFCKEIKSLLNNICSN